MRKGPRRAEQLLGNDKLNIAWWHCGVMSSTPCRPGVGSPTPNGPVADRKLTYSWLYGDAIPAKSPRTLRDSRTWITPTILRRHAGIARICDHVMYTSIMLMRLIDSGR